MKILVNATERYPDLDHIVVQQVTVDLGSDRANIKYVLEDISNEQIVGQRGLSLQTEDYEAWGSDDSYVKNWILAQLQLTEREDAYGG